MKLKCIKVEEKFDVKGDSKEEVKEYLLNLLRQSHSQLTWLAENGTKSDFQRYMKLRDKLEELGKAVKSAGA